MRIQLWSYNYDPEPTGIGPLSATWARSMASRGHDVSVVAAQPHYPARIWGGSVLPYREQRDGVPLLRLPLWSGRASTAARLRQEASFTAALTAALPTLGTPDVIVAVSPCFPAIAPTMLNARARRTPWILWLQDILPDGAASTGILEQGLLLSVARRLEQAAYSSAARIVVISESFRENLRQKGVPDAKMTRVYNVATRPILRAPRRESPTPEPLILTMGNISHTQNLVAIVRAFQESQGLRARRARLILAGDGLAAPEVRAVIRDRRIEITGILDLDALERYLRAATVALVSQHYGGVDFNVPSKLMNFMASGLATVAAVRPESEVARLIRASGGGWVTASPQACAAQLVRVLDDPAERQRRGAAALLFARRHFDVETSVASFEGLLSEVTKARTNLD